MTRLRLTAVLACVLLAAAAPAQFHESPDPGTGAGGCANWLCYQMYAQTQCWPQGEPTGVRAKRCYVTCDSGACWCDYQGFCYSI